MLLLLTAGACPRVRAHAIASEVSFGRSATPAGPARAYGTARLELAVELSEALQLSAAAALTRAERDALAPPAQVYSFGVNGLSGDFTLDAELSAAPTATLTYPDALAGAALSSQDRMAWYGLSLGLGVDAHELYGTDSGPVFGVSLGALYNSGTHATLDDAGAPIEGAESFSFVQWRAALELSHTLFGHTLVTASAAVYLYSEHSFSSHATGVAPADSTLQGLLLASPRYGLRAQLDQELGDLRLGVHGQIARDSANAASLLLGLTAEWTVFDSLSAWITGNVQRADAKRGPASSVLWTSVGTRVGF